MAKRKGPLRAKKKREPGYDGKRELRPDEVAHPRLAGEKQTVVRNVRESALSTMRVRGQIDDAQYLAGDWVRRKIEASRMSSGAIDPSQEPVDTSGHGDPIPDRVISAAQAVKKARDQVGDDLWPLIQAICGDGMTIKEAADRRYGFSTKRQQLSEGVRFRKALDRLAVYLGYAEPNRD